jgi:hypothetical protein
MDAFSPENILNLELLPYLINEDDRDSDALRDSLKTAYLRVGAGIQIQVF